MTQEERLKGNIFDEYRSIKEFPLSGDRGTPCKSIRKLCACEVHVAATPALLLVTGIFLYQVCVTGNLGQKLDAVIHGSALSRIDQCLSTFGADVPGFGMV